MIDTGISAAFEVSGPSALFTDPVKKISGEKMSYLVPTYGALQGMAKNIYFKPTFDWVIEKVRVMNRIRTHSRGAKLMKYRGGPADLADYLYLVDVRYQVLGHLVWNDNLPELEADRIVEKHRAILERTLANIGSRRPVTLGPSECYAEVRPCIYGEGAGFYDNSGIMNFGLMEHGITFPGEGYDDETRQFVTAHFWNAVMKNGEIVFPLSKDCPFHKPLHEWTPERKEVSV